MDETLKPVRWIGTSLRDLRSFPSSVKTDIAFEIVASHHGMASRAVLYRTFLGGHLCFARVSEEINKRYRHADNGDRGKRRLIEAERDYRERQN